MRVLQIRAFIPGLGDVDLLGSPPLEAAAKRGSQDSKDSRPFAMGGVFLVPYANRVRGTLLPDGRAIETEVAGRTMRLPANWHGHKAGAELHAIHGLILDTAMNSVREEKAANGSTATGLLRAGDFGGHWTGNTDLTFHLALTPTAVDLHVTATNTGDDVVPMGIGWHPYFLVLSKHREQARLHIPAHARSLVNNYDDVFPTGQPAPVRATEYDFSAPGGRALGNAYLDDNFTDLVRQPDGSLVCEIVDAAVAHGLRVTGTSPEIKSIQVYAPPDKQFVALEPQFNLADPFNRAAWGDRDTGMVALDPGQSVSYHVRLELFIPA